jgi:hypothetical protein
MVWACIFTHSKQEKTNMTIYYRVRGVVYNTKRAALKALGNMQESRAIAKMIEITGHDCDASGLTRLCERGVVYKGKRLTLLDAFFVIARSVRPAIVSLDIMKISLSGKVPEDFDFANAHPFVPGSRYYEIARTVVPVVTPDFHVKGECKPTAPKRAQTPKKADPLVDTLTAEDLGLAPRISIEQLNAEGVSDYELSLYKDKKR